MITALIMMFLLHQPNRKEKIKKYKRQNEKLLKSLDKSNSLDAVVEENIEARNIIFNRYNYCTFSSNQVLLLLDIEKE